MFKKVEGRWFSSHVLSGEGNGVVGGETSPSVLRFEQGREWLAKKRPPLSCVSSKGGSGWQRNDPLRLVFQAREGVEGVLGKEMTPLRLAFRAREGGNGRRTSLLDLVFRVGGSRGGWLEENPLPPSCVSSREGVGGWLKGKPHPSVLRFEQGGSRGVVGGETSPLCLALRAREGWAAGYGKERPLRLAFGAREGAGGWLNNLVSQYINIFNVNTINWQTTYPLLGLISGRQVMWWWLRCGGQRPKDELAAPRRDFGRSLKNGSNPLPVATGTGFWGVQKSVPVPVPWSYPWHYLCVFPYPWQSLRGGNDDGSSWTDTLQAESQHNSNKRQREREEPQIEAESVSSQRKLRNKTLWIISIFTILSQTKKMKMKHTMCMPQLYPGNIWF